MPEPDDTTLLKQYAEGDESVFTVLYGRYVHLVYSTALRQVHNPSHAEEITQVVFVILTQKAKTIRPKTVLSGWLYQTARLTAANFIRGEVRRQRREQEAYMQSILTEPETASWEQIAPWLDKAMGHLGEKDRNAIVLRFFENKTPQEVAMTLELNEVTARRHVSRALEKLRKFSNKHGVVLTVTIIAGAISANSVQAAPVGLVATAASGKAISTTTTTLVKATMKTMTWLKLKFAIGVSMAEFLAVGAATVAISQTGSDDNKLRAQEIAKQALDTYAALSSYSDTGTVISEGGGQTTTTTTFSIRLQRPDLYRIEWTEGSDTVKGVVWSDGNANFFVVEGDGQDGTGKPEEMQNMQMALGAATGVSGTAAATVPGIFFNQNWGDDLKVFASGHSEVKTENDAKVGGVDCYVVSSMIDSTKLSKSKRLPKRMGKLGKSTTTLWIGKHDHLIHQTRTTMEGATSIMPGVSDSDIKIILELQNKPATPEAIAALRTELETSTKLAQSALSSGNIIFTQTHEFLARHCSDFA